MDAAAAPNFDRPNLAEDVARHLAERIIEGAIAPLKPLREKALVDDLGVSRGTLREALLILERQCLVESSPRRGARAAPLDHAWATEIHEVWYALFEVLLVHLARRADADVKRRIEEAVANLNDLPEDASVFIGHAMELVETLCRIHGEGVLTRHLADLTPATRRCFRYVIQHDSTEIGDTRDFAVAAARAAVEGDAEAVRSLVRAAAVRQAQRLADVLGA